MPQPDRRDPAPGWFVATVIVTALVVITVVLGVAAWAAIRLVNHFT